MLTTSGAPEASVPVVRHPGTPEAANPTSILATGVQTAAIPLLTGSKKTHVNAVETSSARQRAARKALLTLSGPNGVSDLTLGPLTWRGEHPHKPQPQGSVQPRHHPKLTPCVSILFASVTVLSSLCFVIQF